MPPLMSLRDLVKDYGEVRALDHVSLEVEDGETLAVFGPNGAGKTTLLRIMAGIEAPTSGRIYYRGVEVDGKGLAELRRRCTMVFQRTVIFNTTVYKNVAYGLAVRGLPQNEVAKKVKDALNLVKLKGYERRPARRLSGGEQQRVALARAIVLEPELLLLDEPTANLDPETASIIEETIRYMNRERGTTVVVATHNVFGMGKVAERAILLMNGRIVEEGSVSDVLLRVSLRDAGFSMLDNIFVGWAEPTPNGTSAIDIGGGVKIEALGKRRGRVTALIPPIDIIVSKKPLDSSARNVLKGRIVEVSEAGSTVRLKVEAGRVFTAQITETSLKEMKLNVGSEVYLTFKASSIRLL